MPTNFINFTNFIKFDKFRIEISQRFGTVKFPNPTTYALLLGASPTLATLKIIAHVGGVWAWGLEVALPTMLSPPQILGKRP